MSDEVYTLGVWRVKDGKQSEFVAAWQELGSYFSSLPHPPGKGTLLQSVDDPQQFYSFGPWRALEHIQEMRGQAETPNKIGKLMELCEKRTTRDVSGGRDRLKRVGLTRSARLECAAFAHAVERLKPHGITHVYAPLGTARLALSGALRSARSGGSRVL